MAVSGAWTYTLDGSNNATITDYDSFGAKIESGCGDFDGSGDYLSIPDSSDWAFGSNNFTIDFWFYANTFAPRNQSFVTQRNGYTSGHSFAIFTEYDELLFTYSTNGSSGNFNIFNGGSLSVKTWYHIALVREGVNIKFYVNGTLYDTAWNIGSASLYDSSVDLRIGASDSPIALPFDGYIDEVRVSKGIARWTSNFTPPTSEYASDSNTQLLLHMEGTTGSTTFTDSGNTGHTVTANGNAQIYATQSGGGYNPTIPNSLDGYDVVAVADNALKSKSLDTVTFDYIVNLGDNSFASNGSIGVNLNVNLTTSGVSELSPPFEGCSIADNLSIGSSVTSIPDNLFSDSGLTALTLPSGLLTIGDYSFSDNAITNLSIPTTVTLIDDYAFTRNSLSSIVLGHSMAINKNAFANNGNLSVTISGNISSNATSTVGIFENCTLANNTIISEGVTSIPSGAFSDAGLTEILFPESMVSIGTGALYDNDNLSSITFEAKTTVAFGSFVLDQSQPSPKGDIYGYDTSVETWAAGYSTYYDYTMLTSGTTAIFEVLEYQKTETANAGTTTTIVNATAHGLAVDDLIVNETRRGLDAERGCRIVKTISSADSFIVDSLAGQTTGDSIRLHHFVDRTDKVRVQTLRATIGTQGVRTLSLTLKTDKDYLPQVGQYCRFGITQSGYTRYFLGIIQTANTRLVSNSITADPNDTLFMDITATSLNSIPSRRTIEVAYPAGTDFGDIVDDMVDDYLNGDGIKSGTIDTGAALDVDWYQDVISIAEVLDRCAKESGYQWFIDEDGALQFYAEPSTFPTATYNIDSTDTAEDAFTDYSDVVVSSNIDQYLNKQFIMGGFDERGNPLIISSEDFDESTDMQEVCAGTGVYGNIIRDSGIIGSDYITSLAGTTTTNITYTAHGQTVGDMVWNLTRDEYRLVTAVVDADNFTVASVTSQTTGDIIVFFDKANDMIDNAFKVSGRVPKIVRFNTRTLDFNAGEKMTINIPELGIDDETYLINQIEIFDYVGIQGSETNGWKMRVTCVLRDDSNFSTQRLGNYKDFWDNF